MEVKYFCVGPVLAEKPALRLWKVLIYIFFYVSKYINVEQSPL